MEKIIVIVGHGAHFIPKDIIASIARTEGCQVVLSEHPPLPELELPRLYPLVEPPAMNRKKRRSKPNGKWYSTR